ncbi:hypothetical protein KY290_014787 [Solanum tuberosum]|uniref:Uncharacterized protein n=1 Tax=Solanum tuberosum TaxID=4113 RepID=A0ABQ7VRW3_SOLTU|nr:hypothetical protein KY284_014193 [Solanum tuberosum]KAH0770806.1 hypothetical protein KY290_014787 [Solanum tuberosum]
MVVVKASKEVPKNDVVWALTHVVQPGDYITLLVVVPSYFQAKLILALERMGKIVSPSRRIYFSSH